MQFLTSPGSFQSIKKSQTFLSSPTQNPFSFFWYLQSSESSEVQPKCDVTVKARCQYTFPLDLIYSLDTGLLQEYV